jgi:hypothetical protein
MEPKTISAGEYFAIRAKQETARARPLGECTQSAGEIAAPRATAVGDNMSDDSKMSSPKKTETGDASGGSPMDQEMRDDSSLSSQSKAAERQGRYCQRSPTPEVDYEGSDVQSEHGANDEAKTTSQSSFVATPSPYSPPFSLADGSVKEEGEVEETHLNRGDRDDKVITNATEESEARAAYSMVDIQPQLPSSWVLQRLGGYSDKRWPHRLFDARPVDQDRYLARIASSPVTDVDS